MSSPSGWYPDPGGQPNTYRFWDGRAWSAATSPNPNAAPPSQGLVPGGQPAQQGQAYGSGAYGSQELLHQGGRPQGATPYAGYQAGAAKKTGRGWWLAGAALLVVLVVIVVFAVRQLGGGGLTSGDNPGGQSSQSQCPTRSDASADPSQDPADGRVHGGPLSYPQLGAPWGAPQPDSRVPFGSDVQVQSISVEPGYDGPGTDWVASILVGRLAAGDGFYTPEQGSKIVVKCILGEFYGNNAVNSDVVKDEQTTVDGHEAWITESKLTFDIAGLQTKGERLIVVIVSTDASSSGIYYASIPDTVPQYLPAARQVLAQLKVDG